MNEQMIRELAYSKWESAGYPCGNGVDFWLEAENELDKEYNPKKPKLLREERGAAAKVSAAPRR